MLARLSLLTHSIRFRLALWFVAILGVVIVLFSAFIYTRQLYDLRVAAVNRLDIKAQRLASFLRFSDHDYFEESPLRVPRDPQSNEVLLQDTDVLAFMDSGGNVIQSWGPLSDDVIPQMVADAYRSGQSGRGGTVRLFTARIQVKLRPSRYIFMVAPVSFDRGIAGFYLMGSPIDPERQLPRLLLSLLLGAALTLAVALLGGFWLADRAMRPVKKITETARSIGETDLSRRIHLYSKDELGELASTFDGMLSRLQAAFERQRQFTADASHELRTPLTIVELEASRALTTHRSPQEYERAIRVIQGENQFMTRLVNNLLTLARMDAGQVVLNTEVLDLSDVSLEVVERLAPLALKSQVRLTTGSLPELLVRGDRQYLSQMLSNLVENGIKYSTGDDRRVLVETGRREGPSGPEAWVRVSDNGQGISPEHLPHLFDRFYQVDKARTQQDLSGEPNDDQAASGAGLGLSIVQWIVQAHDGQIRVQSTPGKGASFEISLPLFTAPSPESAKE